MLDIEHFGHQDGISNPRVIVEDIEKEVNNHRCPGSLVKAERPGLSRSSPRTRGNGGSQRQARETDAYTAIRLDSRMLRDFWLVWLEAADMKDVCLQDEVRCNRLSTSIQAAIEGVGFAIARTSVMQPDLDAGLLIAPFRLRVDAGEEGYFIVVPPDCAKMRKVESSRSWALATLARSAGQSDSMHP